MSDDIVWRLHHQAFLNAVGPFKDMLIEAADEIIRLRAELEKITKLGDVIAGEASWVAREALRKK
jgi:hypothetical protein